MPAVSMQIYSSSYMVTGVRYEKGYREARGTTPKILAHLGQSSM